MATWVDKHKYLHMHKQYRFPIGSLAVKEPSSMNCKVAYMSLSNIDSLEENNFSDLENQSHRIEELSSSSWWARWCSSHGYRHHHPRRSGSSSSSGHQVVPSAWMATGSCWPPWNVDQRSWSHGQDPQCRWCCGSQGPNEQQAGRQHLDSNWNVL